MTNTQETCMWRGKNESGEIIHCHNSGEWHTLDERFGSWSGAETFLCERHWQAICLICEEPRLVDNLLNPRIPWNVREEQEQTE